MNPGDVISYIDMCKEEGVNLQRGMNFRLRSGRSVILMSLRPGAPYKDRVEEDGRVLIYEGHDIPRTKGAPDPKSVDQPESHHGGTLTENGKFKSAALAAKDGRSDPEKIRVYEKIRAGIWTYNGTFALLDAWQESDGKRKVFKFRLEALDEQETPDQGVQEQSDLPHTRMIPTAVKLEVWKRDHGKCVKCGSSDNLHFDHLLPFSKGGTSLKPENIQLLCARHNLQKRDRID